MVNTHLFNHVYFLSEYLFSNVLVVALGLVAVVEESPEEALETPPRQNVAVVVDGDDERAFFQRALNLDGVAVAELTPAVQARITSSLRRKPDRASVEHSSNYGRPGRAPENTGHEGQANWRDYASERNSDLIFTYLLKSVVAYLLNWQAFQLLVSLQALHMLVRDADSFQLLKQRGASSSGFVPLL